MSAGKTRTMLNMNACASLLLLTLSTLATIASAQGYGEASDCAPMNPPSCEWVTPLPAEHRLEDAEDETPPKDVVLFTDGTNFDDVVTLLFLAKSSRSNLKAVYLQGNAWASPGSSFRNMFNMLHMMGKEFEGVPIFAGSYYAIADILEAEESGDPIAITYRPPVPMGSSGVLYSDTLHGMAPFVPQGPNVYDIRTTPDEDSKSIPAFIQLVETLSELTIVSVGTLTPIAKMFTDEYVEEFESKVVPKISQFVQMGGAVDVPGNLFSKPTNLKAEFNIYNDPHAAQWAFKNLTDRGVPTTMVPLDGTDSVPIQERLLEELRNMPLTPEAQLTGRVMENLRDTWFAPDLFFETAFLWDPSAAVASLYPDVITSSEDRYVRVVFEEGPDGPNQGWTKPCDDVEVADDMCALIRVVMGFDPDGVTDTLLNTLNDSAGSAEKGLVCL